MRQRWAPRRTLLLTVLCVGFGVALACSQLPLKGDGEPVNAVPLDWLRKALQDPIINLFASVGVGGLIGGITGWCFAKRSGDELKTEAGKLRHGLNLLAQAMERQGWVDVVWDDEGNVVSLFARLGGAASVTSSGRANLTVGTTPDPSLEQPAP